MLDFINNLIAKWSCSHDWEELKEISTYESSASSRPYKRTYLYRCKKCGKFKKIILR